jgi:hypothetical protein
MQPEQLLAKAKELVSDLSEQEAGLIRHAANYLRRYPDVTRFQRFLTSAHCSGASQRSWPGVRGRIAEVLRTTSKPEELAYVLGWAWRLRRVYGARPGARGEHGEGFPRGGRGGPGRGAGGPGGYGGRGSRQGQPRRDEKRW